MVKLKVEKSADRNYVFFGISSRVKYFIVITNIGDAKATCVKVRDIIGKGAYFVPGSFSINGCKQAINNLDNSISVGSIKPGSNILVSYDMEVIEYNTQTELVNQAEVTYCDENDVVLVELSNEVKIPVINMKVNACKSVDRTQVKIGDVISYSVLVRNNSNIPINNVVFYDELSTAVELIPSSVLVNLQPQYVENFDGGLSLGTLNAYSSVMISYQVVVICFPDPPSIKNTSRIEYSYTILDGGISVTSVGETCSNRVITTVVNKRVSC